MPPQTITYGGVKSNRTLMKEPEMYRWRVTSNPQHMLPGSAACALGTIFSVRDEQTKPRHRRRP